MKIALVQQKATADKSANLKRGLENAVKAIEAGNLNRKVSRREAVSR